MTLEVKVDKKGRTYVVLTPELWDELLKFSKIRSRRMRHQKKAVKRMFLAALYRAVEAK